MDPFPDLFQITPPGLFCLPEAGAMGNRRWVGKSIKGRGVEHLHGPHPH